MGGDGIKNRSRDADASYSPRECARGSFGLDREIQRTENDLKIRQFEDLRIRTQPIRKLKLEYSGSEDLNGFRGIQNFRILEFSNLILLRIGREIFALYIFD